jgi:hypothetical protein
MKKMISLAIALSFALSGCSFHQAYLSYDEFKDRMILKNDAVAGQDLGAVTGSHGGAIWDDCPGKARSSINRLIDAAKAKGANAIGNITWYTAKDKAASTTPTCKKSWGYVLIWPLLLTPLFMVTRVDGTAYKTTAAKAKSAGLYMLPNTQAEHDALVEQLMAM